MHSVCHGRIWTHMHCHKQPFWAKWWRNCRTTHAGESFWLPRGGPTCPGSSCHVQPNPTEPSLSVISAHTTIQSDSTQESVKPKSTCVAPRASAIKEQGFFEAVPARIEAPQKGSTSLWGKVGHFYKDGLQGTPYKVSGRLPYVPVPGQEVTAEYHWWLQASNCW